MAYDARLAFARNLSRGESCVDLALAALQIAAEDDAIGEGMNLKSKESFLNSVSCGRGFICDKSGRGFQISLFYRGCFNVIGHRRSNSRVKLETGCQGHQCLHLLGRCPPQLEL